MNPGNATDHPSFVVSTYFANQVLAQIEMFANTSDNPLGVHVLPKKLEEKVARLHPDAFGAALTKPIPEQAKCIGVEV